MAGLEEGKPLAEQRAAAAAAVAQLGCLGRAASVNNMLPPALGR